MFQISCHPDEFWLERADLCQESSKADTVGQRQSFAFM
jgi:hypothetical protein